MPMTTRSMRARRGAPRPSAALLALASAVTPAALALLPGTVRAEPNPYYIGASLGVTHDSNVFRRTAATSDTYYSAGLLAGFDQPIGRQRVFGSGVVRYNRYSDLGQLDNTSYGVNAGLDWSTINRLSGSVVVSANQSLANYGDSSVTQAAVRNIEKSNQALARIQYGAASLLVLEGSVTHRNLSYSDPLYQASGLTQNAVSGGISYRPSGRLTVGAALRFTKGDYDVAGSEFDRRDIDLTTTWVPTGQSTVNARLSVGKQTATQVGAARDFSGVSGYVSWLYQPTGKLRFNTWVSRDTGAESSFFDTANDPQLGVARGDTSDVTNTVAVDAAYAATAKINVNAGLRFAQRSLERGALDGSDRVYGAQLGATYQAQRWLLFACSVGRETRNASNLQLSSPYGATTATCSVEATLR